ncbi:hypothetical protein [Nocardiopsis synnemataformans]|uniref:hypothetical protein n=1 Tax=Nocardiopsis synnemataformans TaxID=61305 RepID=UPI003EB732EC
MNRAGPVNRPEAETPSSATTKRITAFAHTLVHLLVERVVIADGELSDRPGALEVTALIEQVGYAVVIANNGILLTRSRVAKHLVKLGVDGVSVSLDGAEACINDRLHPSRSGLFGYD